MIHKKDGNDMAKIVAKLAEKINSEMVEEYGGVRFPPPPPHHSQFRYNSVHDYDYYIVKRFDYFITRSSQKLFPSD